MKRYISAVLIPCFLMQLFGCYSTNNITVNELPKFDEAMIITNTTTTYYLTDKISNEEMINNPTVFYSSDWIVKPDSEKITLITQKAKKDENQGANSWTIDKKEIDIKYSEINDISGTEFSYWKTILLAGPILYIIWGVLGGFHPGGSRDTGGAYYTPDDWTR